jgi:uncharacterized repeat protein (TIGR03803 family)
MKTRGASYCLSGKRRDYQAQLVGTAAREKAKFPAFVIHVGLAFAFFFLSLAAKGEIVVTNIYSFIGGSNGFLPDCGLIQGRDGDFYGTAYSGGAYGKGSIYKITPGGSLTLLYSFRGPPLDSGYPEAGLVQGSDGAFYGTAAGPPVNGAYGSVFRIDTNGVFTNLYFFQGGADGGQPAAPLVPGSDGFFYGTTSLGTVFKIGADGTYYTNLHSFNGNDGNSPFAALVQGDDGYLYGTTRGGGTNGRGGTVFKISTNGAFASLYSFPGDGYDFSAGGVYAGLLKSSDGSFYGATSYEVFRMTTNGVVSPVVYFPNEPAPVSTLIQGNDGFLYGATGGGVIRIGTNGTLFRLTSPIVNYNITYPIPPLVQAEDGSLYGTSWDGEAVFQVRFVPPPGPNAVALNTLYSFPAYSNWANPYAGLVQGRDGNFYGTTSTGGASGDGTVYRMTTNGAVTTLYSFTGGADGATPYASLVQGPDGCFYGTTSDGGYFRQGSVFKISADGKFTLLHTFTGAGDSGNPYAPLTPGSDGWFYGTTTGLRYGASTVFKMDTNGTLITLATFSAATNGGVPYGALLQASDGYFYGTTYSGCASNCGGVFRVDVNGHLTNLFSFAGGVNGQNPTAGLVQGTDGYLYGTTQGTDVKSNYGSVFKIDTSGAMTTLHSFTAGADGACPYGKLAQGSDGFFYGTTAYAGTNGGGTVFKISLDGELTTLFSFDGFRTGGKPESGPTFGADGSLYGTTCIAQDHGFAGTAFKLDANGKHTVLHWFNDNEFTFPTSVALGAQGALFGTTSTGGAYGEGSVFQISPNGTYTSLYSFSGQNDGGSPSAGLFEGGDGNLYGTTYGGGVDGDGTVFKITTNGLLDTLHSFDGNDGQGPNPLTQGSDGNFYSTTGNGGQYGDGSVFKISAAGTFVSLHSFSGTNDGANPSAPLLLGSDNSFYGTTSSGGRNGGYGTVFRIDTNGSLTSLHSFSGADGADPVGALAEGADGNLYGTTLKGGTNGAGSVFKISADGIFDSLYSFAGRDGSSPDSGLILGGDGYFYGTTSSGGVSNLGTIFRISSSGALTTLYSFTGVDGENPSGGLEQGSDGTFYGTTPGRLGQGEVVVTIFRFDTQLRIQTMALANGAFNLTWDTEVGRTYQLQYTTDVTSGNWTNLGNAVIASAAMLSFGEPLANDQQRFYRVLQLP